MNNKDMPAALSQSALMALKLISASPEPRQELNAGITGKLIREGYAETVLLPTPYKTRKGQIEFLQITESGEAALAELERRDLNKQPGGEV